MCGILAVYNININQNVFNCALSEMEHRGPDFKKTKFYNRISIGHTRLSILDLNERANQPFEYNGYSIIYNGEVYNYKELIKEHNLSVMTNCDTEVVLLMYIKYGPKCLHYFNGMFSIVIYNNDKDELFVARDRLGIKPLYYKEIKNGVIFSSEIAPILKISPSDFDEFGIRQYKKLRMTLKGYTIYKGINIFPPGHYYLNGKIIKYWDLDIVEKEPPSDDELYELIRHCIKIRTISDVSLGTYLSGGLDSSIITAIVRPTETWTVGFKNLNEFFYSDLVSNYIGTNNHKIVVNEKMFILNLKKMVKIRKEPLSVPNEVLLYIMTKKVKEKNTVVISGEGADELFWGYDRIFKWANTAKELKYSEFDRYYCYGSHEDNEVIDFALSDLPGKRVIDKIAYFYQIYHLHGLLRRVDNSTMLCSVEARVPFVDHRLVEMVAGVPFKWKMGHSFKEPLKKISKNIIPNEVINREKVGFPVPLEQIFKSSDNSILSPYDKWFNYNIDLIKQ